MNSDELEAIWALPTRLNLREQAQSEAMFEFVWARLMGGDGR